MKKVLFADLFGTLISPNLSISEKYFDNINREFSFVCQYINAFLNEGNYLVVVTEPGGHGNFGRIFNQQLAKFNSYIVDDLRSRVTYYLQGNGKIDSQDHISREYINGKICYIGDHPFVGIAVDKKEEAIIDFLQNIQLPYQVYGIGDSAKDIPMLLKILDLGGKSSVIDSYLYRYAYWDGERTTDEIIKNQIFIEFWLRLEQMNKNRYLEGREDAPYSEQEIWLFEEKEKRKYELYQLLYEGNLNLDELNRNYSKHLVCSEYEMLNTWPYKDKFYENYPFGEEVVDRVMSMPCYSSFSEYYTKVLKKAH